MKLIRTTPSSGRRANRRGSEVIELAFLLPLLLGLVFGTCEFGYYFFLQHNLQGAAREGARAAIPFGATQTEASNKITAFLTSAGLTPGDFSVSISPDPGTAAAGTDITVTVEGAWSNVGLRLLGFISSDKIVRGRAVMRREG